MLITYTNGDRHTSVPARRHLSSPPSGWHRTPRAQLGQRCWRRAVGEYRTRSRTPGGADPPPRIRSAARSSTASTSWIGRALHVLQVVFGILVRSAQRRGQ